jgi:hypothetical protein
MAAPLSSQYGFEIRLQILQKPSRAFLQFQEHFPAN